MLRNTENKAKTLHLPDSLDLLSIVTMDTDTDEILLTVDEGLAEMDAIIAANDKAEAIDNTVPCPRCGGSGDIGRITRLGHSTCLRCYGTGVNMRK